MDTLMEKISSFVEPLAEWVHKMTFLNAMAEALQVLLPITVIGREVPPPTVCSRLSTSAGGRRF